MPTPPVAPPLPSSAVSAPRTRRRSGILLALFVFSTMNLQATLRQTGSPAEALGVLSVPFGLLAAGTYFAFKDRNRVTRVVSVAMVAIGGIAFAAGLLQGLSRS